MIKVLLWSILFFCVQINLFLLYKQNILNNLYAQPATHNFTQKQRRLIQRIELIKENNKNNVRALYAFGGSAAREFFFSDEALSSALNFPVINIGTANQSPIDTYRLIDSIDVPNSIAVYMLHPRVLLESEQSTILYSKYLYGESLKYPVYSEATNILIGQLNSGEPAFNLQLLPELNVHAYLLKDFLYKKYQILARRDFSDFFVDDRPTIQHYYQGSMPYEYLITKLRQKIQQKQSRYIENLATNLRILEAIVELAREKSLNFIVFELPLSDSIISEYKEFLPGYFAQIREFIENNPNIAYIHFDYEQYKENQRYFFDSLHLNPEGRVYFKDYMLNGLYFSIHQK